MNEPAQQREKARMAARSGQVAIAELLRVGGGGEPADPASPHMLGYLIDCLIAAIELVDPELHDFTALHMALRHEQVRSVPTPSR